MIDKATYEKMMERWGDVSSWAVWRPRLKNATSNVGNMDWTKDENLLDTLNTRFVFVGLNCSEGEKKDEEGKAKEPVVPWRNFHSPWVRAKDFKLRCAFEGTPYWGSYITDFYKKLPITNSHDIPARIRQEPWRVADAVRTLEEEIAALGGDKVLVGIGKDAHALLVEHFGNMYKVVGIRHYSDWQNDVNYRAEVIEALKEVK